MLGTKSQRFFFVQDLTLAISGIPAHRVSFDRLEQLTVNLVESHQKTLLYYFKAWAANIKTCKLA